MSPIKPAFSYRLLSFALFVLWILHAAWLAIKNNQPAFLWQRLGFFSHSEFKQTIWIHAASVGEIELIKPLVEILHKNHAILVTTFTITGYQHALRTLPAAVSITALPIDLMPVSQRFIKQFNFKLALIAETELWPETLFQAAKKGIPLIQINARLSDKSLNTSNWTKVLLTNTLGYFDRYLTRTPQDVNNLMSMGADKNKISVAGNLKYAHTATDNHYDRLIQQPYILFASTHDPEEVLFAGLIRQLELKQLVIIAPRHPQRANKIIKALGPLGLTIKQRSLGEDITSDTQVYLADTLGELTAFMTFATLVVMGGSFDQTGGHNVLEPVRLGKAVITGPSDSNIQQDIAFLLQHDAIIQVTGKQQLAEEMTSLLHNQEQLETLSKHAKEAIQTQDHILHKYLNEIEAYL